MKLLLVEDEPKMARMLQRGLAEEGHAVDACTTGEDAFGRATAVTYDVVVLDWSLPDTDGITLLGRWRDSGLTTPVMMLTARGTTGEKVTGLKAGADDYLVKPFDFEELLARLDALARRGTAAHGAPKFRGVELDTRRRCFRRGDKEAELTAREFTLAQEFFTHPNDVLSRSRLLSAVWGTDFEGNPNVVDVYVGYLRAKLEGVGATDLELASVRSVGYRLTGKDSGA